MLDSNKWNITQSIEAIAKKRAKQRSRRKVMETYERIDYKKCNFLGVGSTGPEWGSCLRRLTKDLRTGDVIDDEYRLQERDKSWLFRHIPGAPRDLRTGFYCEGYDQKSLCPDGMYSSEDEASEPDAVHSERITGVRKPYFSGCVYSVQNEIHSTAFTCIESCMHMDAIWTQTEGPFANC